jgi:hypothetical protein
MYLRPGGDGSDRGNQSAGLDIFADITRRTFLQSLRDLGVARVFGEYDDLSPSDLR